MCGLVRTADILEQIYNADFGLLIGNCGHIDMDKLQFSLELILIGEVQNVNGSG